MFHCHGWYTAVACRRFSNAEFVNQTFKWEPVPWEGTHTHRGTQMQICTQTDTDGHAHTDMHADGHLQADRDAHTTGATEACNLSMLYTTTR